MRDTIEELQRAKQQSQEEIKKYQAACTRARSRLKLALQYVESAVDAHRGLTHASLQDVDTSVFDRCDDCTLQLISELAQNALSNTSSEIYDPAWEASVARTHSDHTKAKTMELLRRCQPSHRSVVCVQFDDRVRLPRMQRASVFQAEFQAAVENLGAFTDLHNTFKNQIDSYIRLASVIEEMVNLVLDAHRKMASGESLDFAALLEGLTLQRQRLDVPSSPSHTELQRDTSSILGDYNLLQQEDVLFALSQALSQQVTPWHEAAALGDALIAEVLALEQHNTSR